MKIVKHIPNARLPARAVEAHDEFVRESVSPHTLRAYRAQSRIWARWCDRHGLSAYCPPTSARHDATEDERKALEQAIASWRQALPVAALTDSVAAWLSERARGDAAAKPAIKPVSRATIASAIAALRWTYANYGVRLDTEAPVLVAARRSIRRSEKTGVIKQAAPLTASILRGILLASNGHMASKHARRDACVVALLYSFGLRRSELVTLDYQTQGNGLGVLEIDHDIVRVTLHPKTSQEMAQILEIRRADNAASFAAVEKWILDGGIVPGTPVVRRLYPAGTVSVKRLNDNRVSSVVKVAVGRYFVSEGTDPAKARQLAERFSGHSGRVGLVVSSAEAGASDTSIMSVTRHKSAQMVARYSAQARSRSAAPHKRKGVGM